MVIPLCVKDKRACGNLCLVLGAGSPRGPARAGSGWQAECSTSRDSSQASCPDPCSLNPSAVRGWRAISTSRKHCQKKPRQCCYAGAIMSETQKGITTCKRAGAGSDSPGAPAHGSSPPRDGHGAPAVAPCAQQHPGRAPLTHSPALHSSQDPLAQSPWQPPQPSVTPQPGRGGGSFSISSASIGAGTDPGSIPPQEPSL